MDGDNCLCFVNGAELTNEREAAVEDAAFVVEFVADGHNASEVVDCPLNRGGPSTAVV